MPHDHRIVVAIAQVCHDANRAFCRTQGDFSQSEWNFADQWQRDSAIRGVAYALANPENTPEDQHNAWAKDKYADGWKYGPEKDAEKKTHPCLVKYAELPPAQRVKDALFLGIVRALAVQL